MAPSLFVCFENLPFPFIGIIWKERPEKRELEEETNPWEGKQDLKEQEEKNPNKGLLKGALLVYVFVSIKKDFCVVWRPFGCQSQVPQS